MKKITQAVQPQAEANNSKAKAKSVASSKSKKLNKKPDAVGGSATPGEQVHPAQTATQAVATAIPLGIYNGDVGKKAIELVASALKLHGAGDSKLAPAPVNKAKAEHWADLVNRNLRRSVEELIQAGKHLIAAHEQLDHGQWMKLFDQKLVHLHVREAQRLMQFARNTVLSNANNCSLLPPSPQALAALAQADPEALEQALTAGLINPQTTIANAKKFLNDHPAPGAKACAAERPKEFDPDRSLARCGHVLWGEMNKWPDVYLALLLSGLEEILEQMKAAARNVGDSTDAHETTAGEKLCS